jgi:peptide deformylase
MILDVLTVLDERLRQKSKPVTEFNDELKKLVRDMLETMYEAPGIGLAAPQVGVFKRVVVFVTGRDDDAERAEYVAVNPVIVAASAQMATETEGCLSVPIPGYEVSITRPASVTVRYQDVGGKEHSETFTGLGAVVVQHEMDHLDGITIADRLSPLKRNMVLKKLRKQE